MVAILLCGLDVFGISQLQLHPEHIFYIDFIALLGQVCTIAGLGDFECHFYRFRLSLKSNIQTALSHLQAHLQIEFFEEVAQCLLLFFQLTSKIYILLTQPALQLENHNEERSNNQDLCHH